MKKSPNKKWILVVAIGMWFTNMQATAEVIDNKVQFVPYDKNRATLVKTKRGFATHIQLDKEEAITAVAGGDSSNWNVSAIKGNNDLFFSPKNAAHDTNIVVATTKRNYVFDLRVLSNNASDKGTWYLAFTYERELKSIVGSAEAVPTKEQMVKAEQANIKALATEPLPVKNSQYSMQVMPKSEEIAPKKAWDDGNFTYLYIPNHREIPAVFRVAVDDSETMVNTHMESYIGDDNKDTIVIHGVAKHYVLRLSKQVVGIWNDAYDIDGGSPKNGTVIPHVSRKVVE
ncbi:MAG TPA: TrbG/VirB9 family P-type conjugative transfer protein [Methylotenera sp.]|nr:TrbG/VirB9 family P-type conjugative transfer protein [Methylotenera sp.]HPN01026.1 TrbG/VirB9 family P-type conjugative transfer protein [Methylotenera sp.]